ncbi:DNA-binding protein [Streptomyces sp. NPDC058694]|uniref:DNA-binding protein n=1 Tax=Streptomyces sp. NPDC058694 TaxID=3346603 RepID=UPI0036666446
MPAATAFRHVRGLFVRLAAHGLPPSSPGAGDLRRLAKAAAGRDALVEEVAYLREMLTLPGTVKAPPGWWKAHRPALLELAGQEPAVRGTLLELMPSGWELADLPQWLDLLEKSGATAGLCDTTLPAEVRPADGTAGWTRRFLELCKAEYRHLAPAGLYPLVDRMADTLRTELTTSESTLQPPCGDVNLLDQLLALGIPLADPWEGAGMGLRAWAACEHRRDLVALEADTRFHPAFRTACPQEERQDGMRTVLALAECPGARPMLAEWVGEVSRWYVTAELPGNAGHSGALRTLSWLPGEVLAVAETAVREALSTGIAPALARALRTGILDELGWPAWDEAVAAAPEKLESLENFQVMDAWPHLIVRLGLQIRVIGAEGTLLTHELNLPEKLTRSPSYANCHYVDGELFVWWSSYVSPDREGYWHQDPSQVMPVEYAGYSRASRVGDDLSRVSIPFPGGGRATGGGVLRRGDTVVPPARQVISDGTSYWVWDYAGPERRDHTWFEYDPVSNTQGEPGLPDWFAEGVRTAPEGSTFEAGWLLPAPSAVPGPMCSPVDGLLGWRVVTLPDGSRRGEDLAGRSVVVPPGTYQNPRWALEFPGADRPMAVSKQYNEIRLLNADGVEMAGIPRDQTAGPFTAGTRLLPPLRYWHLLQPRDPQGSAALRKVDENTATALLTAAVAESVNTKDAESVENATGTDEERAGADGRDRLAGAVLTLLPQVSHEALRTGIAGVLRFAADQQRILDVARTRLDAAVTGGVQEERRAEPDDSTLTAALQGLGVNGDRRWSYRRWYTYYGGDDIFRLLRLFGEALRGITEPVPTGRLHLALPEQRCLRAMGWEDLPTLSALVALRAGTAGTVDHHREALDALLAELDAQELAVLDPDHWRRVELRLDESNFKGPDAGRYTSTGNVLPLHGGAFVIFPFGTEQHIDGGRVYGAVFHDPSGRFEAPAPYTLVSAEPFVTGRTRAPGWFTAFRTELAARGPAPWFPAAAEEFARLTGITPTMARLVVAGVPMTDDGKKPVPAETLKAIGVKAADVGVARAALGCDSVQFADSGVWQAVLSALLPAEPSGLWTDGPDVAAAAEVFNRRVGRLTPLPEEVLHDAFRSLEHTSWWKPSDALRGFLDVAAEPRLTRDLNWSIGNGYYPRSEGDTPGFDTDVLNGSVALAAWLAHRLPAGDPVRAVLPSVLTAIRERLAHPHLLVSLGRRVGLEALRRASGAPTETGGDFVRYGAVVVSTRADDPMPAVAPVLLDPAGSDPHLAALFAGKQPSPGETSLRLVHDQRFAELLADPGNPVAGERDADGLWWPQDPARSVPDLVGEVAERYGIGEDAAVIYLMLLAMPDPTDRNTASWTGWTKQRGGTARLRAARAELAATDLVVEGSRSRAGRSLFLPGGWAQLPQPHTPTERWKVPLYDLFDGEEAALGVIVPTGPVAALYRTAWQRVLDGDEPRLEELEVPRPGRGRR